MHKYDTYAALGNKHSALTKIATKITPNSVVLEFAPADGALTKFLTNKKKCIVDIIERDPDSGKIAAKYARKSLIGEDEGDINNYKWFNVFSDTKYDYIILADVLEHLEQPEQVLSYCKELLKDNGSIYISLPNIAHDSVILSLLKDRFEYTSSGLLDGSHIRFFSYVTTEKMFDRLKLYPFYIDAFFVEVGSTEIPITYNDFSNNIIHTIKYCHKLGNVYQFIYGVKTTVPTQVENKIISNKMYNIKFIPKIFPVKNKDSFANEELCIYPTVDYTQDNESYMVECSLANICSTGKIVFAPIQGQRCSIEILFYKFDVDSITLNPVNAISCTNNKYVFLTAYPTIEFIGDFSSATSLKIAYKIHIFNDDELDELNEKVAQQYNALNETRRELVQIKNSRSWRFARMLKNIVDDVLPKDSMRRLFLKMIYHAIKEPRHTLSRLSLENIRKLFYYLKRENPADLDRRIFKHIVQENISKNLIIFPTVKNSNYKTIIFPTFESIKVSIVIPAYNNFSYTYNCLRSIFEHTKGINYEVIVGDDLSSDITNKIETFIKNIHVIHNSENMGFLKTCNEAAKKASGEYIVFLNNDTQVQPDWLYYMTRLMDEHSDIGMTGAKLIYADGRLQEAGGIIWDDGSAWNYGNLMNPDEPEYNYVKDVDYITGAAIMVKSKIWRELNGFDEQYAPIYYEDSDLAFSIRQKGLRVVYQPKSVVVHFEGITSGTDTSKGLKKYQVVNRDKFIQKWEETLQAEHFSPAENVFFARDRSKNKKIVLVVDHYIPTFDKDAGSRTIYNHIKIFLDLNCKVIFVGDNYMREEPYYTALTQLGVEILSGYGWSIKKFDEWIKQNGKYIDFVYLIRPYIAKKYLNSVKIYTKANIFYYTVDLHFLRLRRQYEIEKDESLLRESAQIKKIEHEIISGVDVVFTAGICEQEYLKNKFPNKTICGVPIFFYNNDEFPIITKENLDKRQNILFVGGFSHIPNVDAVIWFNECIMPQLIKRCPRLKFYILGSNPPEKIKRLESENVIVTGFISDDELKNYYKTVRVDVVPLRFGAGVKGKVIEGMFNGIPIVSTSVGLEGMQNIETALQPYNKAEEFAEEIIKLLTDDDYWMELSRKEQRYIKKYFSADFAKELFIKNILLQQGGES